MRQSGSTIRTSVLHIFDGAVARRRELLATEEPLDLRLTERSAGYEQTHQVAVIMRTPGHDFELAAGLLFAQGVLRDKQDIATIRFCTDPETDGQQQYNILTLDLRLGVPFDPGRLARGGMWAASCGICGAAVLDILEGACPAPRSLGPIVAPEVLCDLPDALHTGQGAFDRMGELHAAALFDAAGRLLELREDVEIRNAIDKLIGAQLLAGRLPLADRLMLVSGRADYAIMARALAAGLPFVAGLAAPSSLATDLARRFDMTLVGLSPGRRCTIYAGAQRIALGSGTNTPAGPPPL